MGRCGLSRRPAKRRGKQAARQRASISSVTSHIREASVAAIEARERERHMRAIRYGRRAGSIRRGRPHLYLNVAFVLVVGVVSAYLPSAASAAGASYVAM